MPCNHANCSSEHEHRDPELGSSCDLLSKVDLDKVQCLNEAIDGSGRLVFKAYDDRLDRTKFVESDDDSELLFNIPFTGFVKLRGILIIGGEGGTHPSQMKLYRNRAIMSFDDVRMEPDQSFNLVRDENGTIEYLLKSSKFSSVTSLSIHFPEAISGADKCTLFYIGFRGEYVGDLREQVCITTYEARPLPQDHKSDIPHLGHHHVS